MPECHDSLRSFVTLVTQDKWWYEAYALHLPLCANELPGLSSIAMTKTGNGEYHSLVL